MAKSTGNNQLRVGVIGMGPVGSILAAHLLDAGAFVVPCDVDREKINMIKKAGIRLEHTIQKEVEAAEVCYSADELEKYDPDLVAVSVKAPSLEKVLTRLSEKASERTFVMCVQNGLDNEREVAKVFGEDRTLRMVVNFAGGMTAPNTVHVTFFNPPNYIAALTAQGRATASKIAGLLNSVKLQTEVVDNIRDYVWEKVILNAALSPVCAITRLTMKVVMDSPHGLELVKAIIDESVRIAGAEGIKFGKDFRQFCIKYLKGGGYHRPSMLVDLEGGLQTEIDRLNGKIAEYGSKHNLPTPYNHAITAFVHMLEKSAE
ncbi:MAG: ketopantoate reductase family protein [Candidatus Zixiibacteriota bacterium]|nr:MAG: ketopantoate reductase family protein [candidate division Zixibacteria bacterium]